MESLVDVECSDRSSEVATALQKILSQPDFSASPRLSSFLQFVVTETIEGRADRLKAFTIASMALGYDEKFNPSSNSTVRVLAGRLRRSLELYYRGPGRLDLCEICLRPGSYVPEFRFRSDTRGGSGPTAGPERKFHPPALPMRQRLLRRNCVPTKRVIGASSDWRLLLALGNRVGHVDSICRHSRRFFDYSREPPSR